VVGWIVVYFLRSQTLVKGAAMYRVPRPSASVLSVLLLVLFAVLRAGSGDGATHLVKPDGTGDFPTIRAGIEAATAGDTLLLADGIFTGSGNRDVDYLGKAIVVRSESSIPHSCVLDCAYYPGFSFRSGEGPSSVLEAVKIRQAVGGIMCEASSSPTIKNCVVDGDWHAWNGLSCTEGSSPAVLGCTFTRHSEGTMQSLGASPSFAGCLFVYNVQPMYAESSSVSFTDCDFTGNWGDWLTGGAVHCRATDVVFSGCVFTDNEADGRPGGAVQCEGGGTSVFLQCVFEGNTAPRGGGIDVSDGPAPTLTECTFLANEGYSNGGGLYCLTDGPPSITGCTFTANRAGNGGGLYTQAPEVSISGCTFYGNYTNGVYGGSGLLSWSRFDCDRTIIAFGVHGRAVTSLETPMLSCCDVFGNGGGDWTDGIAGQQGVRGNFSQDPFFCDAEEEDLSLRSDSPCLPGKPPAR
jgi:hypothetical protein